MIWTSLDAAQVAGLVAGSSNSAAGFERQKGC
eukprot:COSAG06_NODE_9534_length_1876_cov_0.939786_3_plen_31_part_01